VSDSTPQEVKLGHEASLLASLLEDGSRLSLLPTELRVDHFDGGSARRLFAAMLAIRDRGEPLTTEGVIEHLHKTGELPGITFRGGEGGVSAIMQWRIAAYAEAVKVGWQGRKIIELHTREQARLARADAARRIDAGQDPAEVIRDLEAKLSALDVADDPDAGLSIVEAGTVFEPQPPIECLVTPIVQRGSLVLLGSFGGSGKTWLALALMLSVASGERWLGRFPSARGRCLFIDYESGKPELCRRSQKAAIGMGIVDPLTIDGFRLACMPRLYMADADFERRMLRLARSHDLVVIDSLRAAARGADENDSRIRDGLDTIQRIAKATRCAFVVIVHAKKMGPDSQKYDERELFRGSSAIFDAADVAYVASFTKGHPIRFSQIKARLGTFVHDFDVRLQDTPGGQGIVIQATDPTGGEARNVGDPLERVIQRVLEVVRKRPGLNLRELRERAGGRGTAVDEAIKQLVDRKKIERLGDGKGSPFSFRPSAVSPSPLRGGTRDTLGEDGVSGHAGTRGHAEKTGTSENTSEPIGTRGVSGSGHARDTLNGEAGDLFADYLEQEGIGGAE
jgi:hypothetical protein